MISFSRKYLYYALAITFSMALIFAQPQLGAAQEPTTEIQWEKPTRIPAPEDSRSWFPDFAVDNQERVHVVWNNTKSTEDEGEIERVFYSMWDGNQWQPYNDIVPPQKDIIRNAIAIDDADALHFVYGWFNLHYKQVRAERALSAASWSSPRPVNSRNGAYMSDITVYKDTVHIIYDDAGPIIEDGPCKAGCADIFYRRSTNGGLTWSVAESLLPTEKGSARAQIEVDQAGVIHVAWDEGWDRISGVGSPEQGVYMVSTDQGETWSKPTIVSYPNSTNAQLTPGSDGQGGVMLVWRTIIADYPGIYYMWSEDQGQSWAPPRAIPGILARGWSSPFDMYDMATDSAGHIHLLVVGHLPEDVTSGKSPGLYHLVWDGGNWSAPIPIFEDTWSPEYPHLVIDRGNQLHTTWFARSYIEDEPHQIWYAHGQAPAPAEMPIIEPTSTPVPTATSTPAPTPRPTPTIDPIIAELSVPEGTTDTIYTEVDDVLLLIQSLLPAFLVIVVVIFMVRVLRR